MRDEIPWIEASRKVTVGVMAVALVPAIFVAINITDTAFLDGGANWRVYTPTDQSYTIDFPGNPNETVQSVPSVFGDVNAHLIEVQTRSSAFLLITANLGRLNFSAGARGSAAAGLVKARAVAFNATVVNDELIDMVGQPDRAMTLAVRSADDVIWYCLLFTDDALFELIVGAETLLGFVAANRFFDSFELR